MKKIISKEIIDFVQKEYNSNPAAVCSKMDIFPGQSIAVGRVRISFNGSNTYLYLDDDVNKKYMASWNEDIGTIILADAKKMNADAYYCFSGDNYKVLLRRIDENELLNFSERGFEYIRLGDFYYIVMKLIKGTSSWVAFDPLNDDEVMPEKDEDPDEPYELTEEPELESISLFE